MKFLHGRSRSRQLARAETCRIGSDLEAGKAGERTIKGFRCRFYDRLMMEGAGTKDVFPFTGTGRNGTLDDPLVLRVLFLGGVPDNTTLNELKEILDGKHQVSRGHCARNSARAIQRALIFLSYPTGSQGTYSIDGDFGHGTNKGFAHFLREWNQNLLLDDQGVHVSDEKLIMPASYTTVKDAVSQLSTIPVKREGMQLLLDSIVNGC